MINESQARKFCKDYTLIENYEEAVYDPSQTWDCHHILGEILTRQQLKDHDFYYDVPPCMLKFLTHAEHRRLHGMNISDDTRKKISESHKGKNNPMYGQHRSDETRRKISEAHKGLTHSDETRRKISEAHNGLTHSDATRRKMSEAMKGKQPTEETRRKMSESAKRRWAANK